MAIMAMSTDRQNFISADEISDMTHYVDVDLYDGTIDEEVSEEQFLSRLADKRIVILVHGYNSDFANTVDAYFSMHGLVQSNYDAVLGHLWPGGKSSLGYHPARCRVTQELDERFAETLRKVGRVAKSVDIIAHSMGCRLTLEALRVDEAPSIRLLHLAAPAVDNEKLEPREDYHSSTQQCDRVYVYHSKHDEVLKYAYPIGDYDRALGYKGAENPNDLPENVKQINMSNHIKSHGGYKHSLYFASHIYKAAREAVERAFANE